MAAPEDASESQVLRSIDVTLSALLAVVLDDYVKSHAVTGAKEKSIERMLTDAGLGTAEVATFLNKTQRAVQMSVAPTKKAAKKAAKKAGKK